MSILVPSTNNEKKESWINVKIWEVINNTLSKIFTFISISSIKIKWIENLDKSKSYLIVANHPAFVDWFLIRDLFLSQDININWIMHNSILETKFLWDYLKSKWHIWVLSRRSINYYLEKWFSLEKARSKFQSRYLKAKKLNKESFEKSKNTLQEWKNLFIFITWGWYLDLKDNPEIYNWYKKIVKLFLNSNETLAILPITINFVNGYKNSSFPIRNEVEIEVNPAISANNWNLEVVYKKIELIYNPWKKDV